MSENDLTLRIGATASDVAPAAQQTKAEITGLQAAVERLALSFKAMGVGAVSGLKTAGQGAKELTEQTKGMLGPLQEAREMLSGFGEALIAAFAIEQLNEFAHKIAETSEEVYHAALTFGLTTDQIQRMKAQAVGAGVPFESMTTAMMRLDRAMATARQGSTQTANAFKEIGINIHEPMTQTQLMQKALEGFSGMEAGPAKVAAAMALFGRNIQAIGPMLNMSKEQMAELNATIDASGAVNAQAEQKGLALAEAFNQQKIAMMGLGNVMADALAPVMTQVVQGVTRMVEAFVRSYQTGGVVKTVMDSLVIATKGLISIFAGLGLAIDAVVRWNVTLIDFVKTLASMLGTYLASGVRVVIDAFETLGQVMADVFSGNFSRAVSDATAGMGRMGEEVHRGTAKMADEALTGGRKVALNFLNGLKDVGDTGVMLRRMWGIDQGPKLPDLPKAGKGTTGDDPTKEHKGKKDKGAEAEATRIGEQALTDARQRFQEEEDAHHDMITNMATDELAFWNKFKTSAEYALLTAEQKQKLQIQIDREVHQQAIEGIRAEMAARHDADTSAISDIQAAASRRRELIGQQIKDVEDAEHAGLMSHTAAQAKILGLVAEEKRAATDAANAILAIRQATDAWIEQHAAAGTSEFKAAKKDEVDAEKQAAQLRVQAINTAQDAIDNRIRKTADEARAAAHSWVDPITSAWASGMTAMIQGTGSFMGMVKGMWQSLLSTVMQKIGQMAADWVVTHVFMTGVQRAQLAIQTGTHVAAETTKTTATTVGATARSAIEVSSTAIVKLVKAIMTALHIGHEVAKTGATVAGTTARTMAETAGNAAALVSQKLTAAAQIPTLVGLAGAGGVASMAAAPFPIDLGAPAFGAAMASAAMGFGAVATAAGGYDIPAGVNPLVQAHAKEMILPASLSERVRAMTTNDNSRGGDTHINHHYNPQIAAGTPQDVVKALEGQSGDFARLLKHAPRQQNRPGARIGDDP